MASETGSSERSSFIETVTNSRNIFLPFILGLTTTSPLQDSTNPTQETQNQATPRESRDRIILINPLTQGIVVIEGSSSSGSSMGLDSLLRDLFSRKIGQRPASKASIDAMPSVEIGENDDEQCVICLEDWNTGEMAKEMPCKHRFHGECIGKWLKVRGSCPVCRYEMPVDEDDDVGKKSSGENDGERRTGIWVSFTFSSDRSRENNQTGSNGSLENSDSSSNHQEMED